MVTARVTISEQDLNGKFKTDGYEYQSVCDTLENSKKSINDIIFECLELDGISGVCFVEVVYDDDKNGYIDSDEFTIRIMKVARTDEPSKFVKWGNKKPHIFAIDKNKTVIVNEY